MKKEKDIPEEEIEALIEEKSKRLSRFGLIMTKAKYFSLGFVIAVGFIFWFERISEATLN